MVRQAEYTSVSICTETSDEVNKTGVSKGEIASVWKQEPGKAKQRIGKQEERRLTCRKECQRREVRKGETGMIKLQQCM